MKVDRELKKGIEEMRCGEQRGFVVFFNKTFQFTCLWTTRLTSDTVRRDDFLSEFYPYVLLHIADLRDDEAVFSWMEGLLPVFYEIWTGSAYADAIRIAHPICRMIPKSVPPLPLSGIRSVKSFTSPKRPKNSAFRPFSSSSLLLPQPSF